MPPTNISRLDGSGSNNWQQLHGLGVGSRQDIIGSGPGSKSKASFSDTWPLIGDLLPPPPRIPYQEGYDIALEGIGVGRNMLGEYNGDTGLRE